MILKKISEFEGESTYTMYEEIEMDTPQGTKAVVLKEAGNYTKSMLQNRIIELQGQINSSQAILDVINEEEKGEELQD